MQNSVRKLVNSLSHFGTLVPEQPRRPGRWKNDPTWQLIFMGTKNNSCRSGVCDSTLRFSQQIYNNHRKAFFAPRYILCGVPPRVLEPELLIVDKNYVAYIWDKDMVQVDSDPSYEKRKIKLEK